MTDIQKESKYITYQLVCFVTVIVVDLLLLVYMSPLLPIGSWQRDAAAWCVGATLPLDFLLLFLRFDP
jgi:biotin transporter BioY